MACVNIDSIICQNLLKARLYNLQHACPSLHGGENECCGGGNHASAQANQWHTMNVCYVTFPLPPRKHWSLYFSPPMRERERDRQGRRGGEGVWERKGGPEYEQQKRKEMGGDCLSSCTSSSANSKAWSGHGLTQYPSQPLLHLM